MNIQLSLNHISIMKTGQLHQYYGENLWINIVKMLESSIDSMDEQAVVR